MPMNSINSEFQQILLAAKERRGDLSVDSMIVSSHLAQMRTFMLRRGIEFYAEQDSFGKRRDFIAKLCEENMLEMKFESISDQRVKVIRFSTSPKIVIGHIEIKPVT
jgi:hypothetical protein